MATVTVDNVRQLIVATIINNKQGVINAMNQTGNNVSQNISDIDLADSVFNVFSQNGLQSLRSILSLVSLDKSKDSTSFLSLEKTFGGQAQQKCGLSDLWGCISSAGDVIGGTSNVAPSVQTTTTAPLVSPTTIIVISIIGIVALIIVAWMFFRKK